MNSPQSETVSEVPVIGALEALFRASRQRVLYPDDHPLRQQALANAAGALSRLLAGRPSLLLSASEEGLEVAGQLERGPAAQRLAAEMRARLIASLDVSAGIAPEEIDVLLGLLSEDPTTVLARGGPKAFLGDQPTMHLRVEAVDFRRHVRESEAGWIESLAVSLETEDSALEGVVRACLDVLPEAEIPDLGTILSTPSLSTGAAAPLSSIPVAPGPAGDSMPAAPGPAAATGEFDLSQEDRPAASLAGLVQRSGETARRRGEPDWSRWQADIGVFFDRLPPDLTARMFRAPAMTDDVGADMLAVLASSRPPEQVAGYIADYPGAVGGEPSSQLARALGRAMPTAARRREVEPHLRARLLEAGMTETAYRNVMGAILDNLVRAQFLPQDTEEAAPAHRPIFGPGAPGDKLADLRATLSFDFVRPAYHNMLLHLLTLEHPPASYASLIHSLGRRIERNLALGRRDEAIELLVALGAEICPDSPRDAAARHVVVAVLHRLVGVRSGELPPAAAARAGEIGAAKLAAIVGAFGGPGIEALIRLLQGQGEPERRRQAWLALAALAEPGLAAVRRLLTAADPSHASRLLAEILANPEAISLCAAALEHPSPAIRQQVVVSLGERPGEASETTLLRALRDSDPRVRRDSAASLGRLRSRRAITALSLLALERVWRGLEGMTREAAIRALGAIGLPECCLALREVLMEEGGWLTRRDRLRVLAAQALAAIPGAQAEENLREGARCRSAGVRRACEQVLAGRGPAGADA